MQLKRNPYTGLYIFLIFFWINKPYFEEMAFDPFYGTIFYRNLEKIRPRKNPYTVLYIIIIFVGRTNPILKK